MAAPGFAISSRELSYKPKDSLPIPSHSWEYLSFVNTNQGVKGWLSTFRRLYVLARGAGRILGSGVQRSWLDLPLLSCVHPDFYKLSFLYWFEGLSTYLTFFFFLMTK